MESCARDDGAVEGRDELPERDREVWQGWLHSVVLCWDADGLPVTLAGPGADPLDEGPVHVVTAFNPGGSVVAAADNAFAQHQLFAELARTGRRWAPAVGAEPDAGHHEISAAIWDLDRRVALDLGRRHVQRAVYEIDDGELRVVACDEDRTVTTARVPDGDHALTSAHLHAWRDELESILGHGIGRVHCPRCGRPDPRRVRPAAAADWTTGPTPGDGPRTLACARCGHRWTR